jgi:hypothetical protein
LPAIQKSNARRPPQEHDAVKSDRLAQLRQDNLAQQRMWQNLGQKTRQEQMEKAIKMTRHNPLAIDQAAEYNRNLSRLRRKYIFKDSPLS